MKRFVSAWERRDVDAVAALLAEDVVLRMPPEQVELLVTGPSPCSLPRSLLVVGWTASNC